MATGTSDCGRTTGTGGQKVFSINVVQPMMFGEPSPNRKLRTRFVVDVKSVFDSWPWEHNEVGGSHDPIQANCKSQAQSSMGMDLSKGFQIEEPCVFVPWDTSEGQFLTGFQGLRLRRVTHGYFTTRCTSLGGVASFFGFSFLAARRWPPFGVRVFSGPFPRFGCIV